MLSAEWLFFSYGKAEPLTFKVPALKQSQTKPFWENDLLLPVSAGTVSPKGRRWCPFEPVNLGY